MGNKGKIQILILDKILVMKGNNIKIILTRRKKYSERYLMETYIIFKFYRKIYKNPKF